jgi:hypothetical protein
VGLVFVMLIPLPTFLLDLLLALSITASVLVLLAAVHILRPVQFSVFPSLLLLLTLFRLSLNLASSRRILLHGSEGPGAAGDVIQAFGQFVVGGNYVVGFVLFLALIAIQFLVVSHGAVRTAEVTARFTLDAMPGKQMAIDADLNAGIIDEKQARARREAVSHEAEFYGAMDGAARFNQRGIFDRSFPVWHSVGRGVKDLHGSDGRRWPGDDDSFPAGLGGGRHRSDSRLFAQFAGKRFAAATVFEPSRAVPRRWRHPVPGADSRPA